MRPRCRTSAPIRVRLTFRVPARGLVGLPRNEFLTITAGREGIMSSQFERLRTSGRRQGSEARQRRDVVSDRECETVATALFDIQERGELFIGPGVPLSRE